MPIYTYICKDCREKSDLLVGVVAKEKDFFKCSKCGSKNIEKVFTPFAVNISGSVENKLRASCSSYSANTCSGCKL